MLSFNTSALFPLALHLCLHSLEDVPSSKHTFIFVRATADSPIPTFSKPVMVLDPSEERTFQLQPLLRSAVLISIVASVEQSLQLQKRLRALEFAGPFVLLQLFPVDGVACGDGWTQSCVRCLHVTHNVDCRPQQLLECDEPRKIHLPAFHWPPILDVPFPAGTVLPVAYAKGFFALIYQTLAQRLRLDITLKVAPHSANCVTDFKDPLSQLVNGTWDLLCLPVNFEVDSTLISKSKVLMVSNTAWAVPLAKPAASMLNLVLPLQRSAWVSVLATACVIWLVARFWAGLSGSKAFVDAVSTMLGASSGSLKTAPRLAVIGIRIGCFILVASYQSQLSSILTVPVFEQQIETPTQLISSSHKLYKLCFNQRILVDEQDQRLPQIERRTETVGRSRVMGVLRQVAEGGAAFLGPDLVLEQMVRADPYLKRHIFVMKRIESFLPVAFLTRRGDPISGRIDSLIGHLNAAGLLVKWERDVLRGPSSVDGNKWPAGHVKIRLSHLTGAFLLWIIGLVAAFSAFLFEVAF